MIVILHGAGLPLKVEENTRISHKLQQWRVKGDRQRAGKLCSRLLNRTESLPIRQPADKRDAGPRDTAHW